jgi:hypothetical protein
VRGRTAAITDSRVGKEDDRRGEQRWRENSMKMRERERCGDAVTMALTEGTVTVTIMLTLTV